MTRAGATRERVLAIGAHPDDVEIGCAGTVLDHRLRGDRITMASGESLVSMVSAGLQKPHAVRLLADLADRGMRSAVDGILNFPIEAIDSDDAMDEYASAGVHTLCPRAARPEPAGVSRLASPATR